MTQRKMSKIDAPPGSGLKEVTLTREDAAKLLRYLQTVLDWPDNPNIEVVREQGHTISLRWPAGSFNLVRVRVQGENEQ